jgi:hypothetical protein
MSNSDLPAREGRTGSLDSTGMVRGTSSIHSLPGNCFVSGEGGNGGFGGAGLMKGL